jgi:chloramphenicol-sensitive protein RarD
LYKDEMTPSQRAGLWYGLVAYGLWGAIPIYFRWLSSFANSSDILAHRIVWSAVMLAVVLSLLKGQWKALRVAFTSPRLALLLLASSILIAVNWFVYIYGVETRRVVQCSLGYFITPLLNVGLGVLLLGERFRPLQGVALACGAIGMLILASLTDSFPWIAISLAFTFGLYTLIRKLAHIETLTGLTAESFILAPLSLVYILSLGTAWQQTDTSGYWMLVFSGPATVIPLFCFGQAARMLPLSTLGFLQYVSPSLQFLVAVLLFGEPVDGYKAVAFAVVWLGLAIFTIDMVQAQRERRRALANEPAPSLAVESN